MNGEWQRGHAMQAGELVEVEVRWRSDQPWVPLEVRYLADPNPWPRIRLFRWLPR